MRVLVLFLCALLVLTGCKPLRSVFGGRERRQAAARDSLDMKIGQMILVGIEERTIIHPEDPLVAELRAGRIGGVVLFEKNLSKTNTSDSLRRLIAALQSFAPTPLFVTIDEEGGGVHRLKEKYGFLPMPSAAHLGELDNADSTSFYNRMLAVQLASLGINLNFAPVVDMAVNAENPVIVKKGRSFSAEPQKVAKHAQLVIDAHHENGVKTILKHFPGHGSSMNDSHLGITDVTDTWQFMELYPYYSIIQSGKSDAIMTAHIINRRWDTLPATLSYKVVNDMLRQLLRFDGVVFSDDMQMHAISKNYGFENAVKYSINAGVDVLMFANTIPEKGDRVSASTAHATIKKLVQQGDISRERIDEAYKRIMALKAKR